MMVTNKNESKIMLVSSLELIDESFQLSDAQKTELAQLYDDMTSRFQTGKVVTGKVVAKDNSGLMVSIDYKSDGLIPHYEFSDFELKKIALNDEIEVMLDKLEDENGAVILSYQKAKALRAWDKITQLATADEPVRGIVTHKVKGGLSVDVGIPAFLPGSQVDTQRVSDFDQFVGQEVTCKILKVNKKRGNIIISRRKFLEEQRYEDKKRALDTIIEGQVLQGSVKNITSYGVFVDVGGIDGLLHITDMSWGRIAHPSEMVKIGDVITVKVISFDKQHEKISLGMKQLTPNPWENVDQRFPVGSKIKGRISSITDYGLFIEVEKGVEGLIHISEISWTERINHLAKHFVMGQEVEALVVALDKDNRRMSLSIKQMSSDPWKLVAEKFKVGDRIKGKISNITDFGLFVQLFEGVDGLVHISDISWTDHVSHPSDRYKKADEVEAIILAIDADNRKVSLGIKQLDKDPWTNVANEYKIGEMVEGTVSKITSFGAFVKMNTGIEGLVHISELSENEVARVEDVLQIGQAAQFRVIKVSPEERKLGLSLRPAREQRQQQETRSSEQYDAPRERAPREQREQREPREQQAPRRQHREEHEEMIIDMKKSKEPVKGSLQQALAEHAAKMKKEADDKEGK